MGTVVGIFSIGGSLGIMGGPRGFRHICNGHCATLAGFSSHSFTVRSKIKSSDLVMKDLNSYISSKSLQ